MDTQTAERAQEMSKSFGHSRSQIVATIGPATRDIEIMRQLQKSGMDVMRLNFSWGTYEEHAEYINVARTVAKELGKRVPVVQDLSGPRMQSEDGHEFNPACESLLSDKDLKDLDFGASQNVEYVAMSYVGCGDDVALIRSEMAKRNMKDTKVIAKIERTVAVEKMHELIEAADAIMIARGDLGNEVPLERIPHVQREIVNACKEARKPVITATQMMLTMVENPYPTRAEVTDVTYASMIGSDAVMLSEETARGKHPVAVVTMMEKILLETEKYTPGVPRFPL